MSDPSQLDLMKRRAMHCWKKVVLSDRLASWTLTTRLIQVRRKFEMNQEQVALRTFYLVWKLAIYQRHRHVQKKGLLLRQLWDYWSRQSNAKVNFPKRAVNPLSCMTDT
jgi:hypothetical protein